MGVDVLDSSYPYMISKQGGALNFINNQKLFNTNITHELVNNAEEPMPKKLKLENGENENQYFISLNDSK